VKLAIRAAAVAGGMLGAFVAAGCGARPGGAGPGCAAYGVYAIEHRITVTSVPAPCRGLSRAEINQAAALAILRVAGGGPKPVWRRRAARVAPFLSHLITGPVPAARSQVSSPGPGPGAPTPSGGTNLALDAAALVAWLITAGSGSCVLGSWLRRGGTLRPGAGATGSPPAVIVGHFGLALGGLVIWAAYLAAGWAALAWTAVGVLLPVVGLGMATVSVGLPGRSPADPAAGELASESPLSTGSIGAIGTAVVGRADVGNLAGVSRRASMSPLVVVAHGLLAISTMALVLLAALGPAAL
jgi:manganese efflux pump family protein